MTWVHDKYFNNCSGGLKFVKFVTNRTHHVEAIFCGIATMALPECAKYYEKYYEKNPLHTCNVDDAWSSNPPPHQGVIHSFVVS